MYHKKWRRQTAQLRALVESSDSDENPGPSNENDNPGLSFADSPTDIQTQEQSDTGEDEYRDDHHPPDSDGVLLYDALAWYVSMPKQIHGLQGSCLVIPCSFYYSSNPPKNPHRVVWYQWVSKGYPLVYDPWYPNDVIEKFRWKTDLYGDPSSRDCSLLIKNLDLSHHGEKLYAWIDPENVGWRTYAFYDVTSTVLVNGHPRQPIISIYGGDRTGDTITVECSTLHTCPYSRPSITLYGIEGSNQIRDESIKDGLWKTTLTRKGVVKAERLTITCTITHYGDITVTTTKDKSAECVYQKITIEPELADVTVSIAKEFTCNVYHSCQNKNPTITWNYKNMEVTEGRKTLSDLKWISYSNIVFQATKEDHGKKLICTVTFSGAYLTAFVVLHVQHHSALGLAKRVGPDPFLRDGVGVPQGLPLMDRVSQNPTVVMILMLIFPTYMEIPDETVASSGAGALTDAKLPHRAYLFNSVL
ncbi:sialoadhesin-like isoform X2 [Labeo rohita]|uniref:Sialoadhesin-like isoform X2 n=1 Tax=Labeo rohita TaxID=84645 RepID=A0A498LRU0_LABRO|nr:sialoadhesin-like isoform X2 [Labeo rohita]